MSLKIDSDPPASSNSTFHKGFSDSRFATTAPADPPPTTHLFDAYHVIVAQMMVTVVDDDDDDHNDGIVECDVQWVTHDDDMNE